MKLCHIAFILVLLVVMAGSAFGDQQHPVITELDTVISQGDSVSQAKLHTIKEAIEKDPEAILPQLLAIAGDPKLPEANLAVYIWAIGLTRSPEAIDDIIGLYSGKKSELVVGNAQRALAAIGGDKAGDYLFSQLDLATGQMARYSLIDLLAQIQYRPALPKAIEILQKDPGEFYWQTIFIFGKYGDAAIPFLLEKIGDDDENVRVNTIMALGQWLLSTASLDALHKQFWQETNPEIRGMILSSLEKVDTDLASIRAFSQKVVAKETDENVKRFAQETVDNHEKMQSRIEDFRQQKKEDPVVFEAEYSRMLKSFGKEGNFDKLAAASSITDEEKLKILRAIILQRNSDECFYDYQKINNIIMMNRFL